MKKLFVLFGLILLASCSKPDSKTVQQNYIKAVDAQNFIACHIGYNYQDASGQEGDAAYDIKVLRNEKDTILGYYFNIKNDEMHYIYCKDKYMEYQPESYGDNIVKLITPDNNPNAFFGYEVNMGGQTFMAPPSMKCLVVHDYLPFQIYSEIKGMLDKNDNPEPRDTLIDGVKCNLLEYTFHDTLVDEKRQFYKNFIAFAQSDYLIRYIRIASHEQTFHVHYSDYSFECKDTKTVFSENDYPDTYKLVENAPYLQKEKMNLDDIAPAFNAKIFGGGTMTEEDLKGKRTLLVFSSVGCAPCQMAVPDLNKLMKEFPELNLVVAYKSSNKDYMADYIKKKNIEYTVLYDTKDMSASYKNYSVPAFYFFDENLVLQSRYSGWGDGSLEEYRKGIAEFLEAK